MSDFKKILLLMNSNRGWSRALLKGISEYRRQHDPDGIYRLFEFQWDLGTKRHAKEIEHIKEWQPDGIVTNEMGFIDEIVAFGVPVIGARLAGVDLTFPVITSDFEATGRMAARFFLDKGFKNFAYCGYSDKEWSCIRLEGFEAELKEHGFDVSCFGQPMTIGQSLGISDLKFISDWLRELPPRTALMTCSDDRSLHVVDACKAVGLSIPQDIAIIGVDDDDVVCELSDPTLSSVRLNNVSSGYEIAEKINRMIDSNCFQDDDIIVKPMKVVSRESTETFCVRDPRIAKALDYISENAHGSILVDDIAEHISLSKRILQIKFKKEIGYAISEHIKREKVEIMAEMLTGSNMPVTDIAKDLGFANGNHITVFFKQIKGVTPTEYRKKYRLESGLSVS